jgi:hypothetical protein
MADAAIVKRQIPARERERATTEGSGKLMW